MGTPELFCQIFEYRLSRSLDLSSALEQGYQANSRLRNDTLEDGTLEPRSEHRVRCIYAAALGEVDFLIIRRCGSFYPFIDPPRISGISMRRSLGFFAPPRDWINSACPESSALFRSLAGSLPDKQTDTEHMCQPTEDRPFVGLIYAELNRIEYLLASTGDATEGSRDGPARRALKSFLSQHHDGKKLTNILRHIRSDKNNPDTSSRFDAHIVPLLGLDRIPLAFLVMATSIDEITAVAAATRQLSAQDRGEDKARLATLLNKKKKTITEWCRSRLLISTTTTVISVQLGRKRPSSFARNTLHLKKYSPDYHWTLGCQELWEKDKGWTRPAFRGGLITYIRQNSSVDEKAQAVLARELQLRPLIAGKGEELHYFGALDSVFAWAPGEVKDNIDDKNGVAFQNEQHRFTIGDILEPLRCLIRSESAQGLDTSTVPYISGVPNPDRVPAEHARKLDNCVKQQLVLLQGVKYKRNNESRKKEWLEKWIWLTNRNTFSYTLTTSGVHLISEVLHALLHDPPTFSELVLALEQWLNQDRVHITKSEKHRPKGKARHETYIKLNPISAEKLGIHFSAMEQLLDARRRRTAPIRRSTRDSASFDTLSGHEVSRQGYAGYAHAVAHYLGLRTPLLVLDSSIGWTNEHHLRGLLTLLKVPASTFLVPLMWRVGSELGRVALKDVYVAEFDRMSDKMEDSHPEVSTRAGELYATLSSFASAAPNQDLTEVSVEELLVWVSDELISTSDQTLRAEFRPLWWMWKRFSEIFVDVPADLLWARVFSTPTKENIKPLSLFWWVYVPSLLHARQELLGRNPLPVDDLGRLLLRISTVHFTLSHADGELPSHDDFFEGLRESFLALKPEHSEQPRESERPWARQLVVLLRHLREDLDSFPNGTTTPGSANFSAWDRALSKLVDGLKFRDKWSEFNTAEQTMADRAESTIPLWLNLCAELYRSWPELIEHREPGALAWRPVDTCWSVDQVRSDMSDYLAAMIAKVTKINGSSPRWLPLYRQSRAPHAEDLSERLPKTTSPWLSYRGAIRAGRDDDNTPSTFFYAYHEVTIKLLLNLARGNRIRRFDILSRLMGTLRSQPADRVDKPKASKS